jgi:hypothetical protein
MTFSLWYFHASMYYNPNWVISIFKIVYSFIYMCIHCLGPLSPLPSPPSPPSSLPGKTCSALFSNFIEDKTYAIIRKT